VFAEDIDRVMGTRDDKANDLINTIDGVISKTAQVMTVLTTNFVERLDRAMLRPGRLDAVISIRPPGPETVGRLIHHYAGRLLHPDADLTEVGVILAGQIPASIREAVERAKLGMISRGDTQVTAEDLKTSALTMVNHLAILAGKKVDPENTPEKMLARGLVGVLGFSREALQEALDNTEHGVNNNTDEEVGLTRRQIGKNHEAVTSALETITEKLNQVID
jgi:transitional endoplasmic reticulum ATPase